MTLREGLLDGMRVALTPSGGEGLLAPGGGEELLTRVDAGPLLEALTEAGASITDDPAEPITALVHDASATFEADGLEGCMARAWSVVASAATGALISSGGGKIVLIAPRRADGAHAEAARDGLTNLARTLSVEWARYGVRTVSIAAGSNTTHEELATLVCFLLSRAGDYFSGCRLDLGSP